MAADTDVILNIRAKTEDAEAKIRRLEAQLKTSAGSALTEAQGRVKRLEDQVKLSAKASQSAFAAAGAAINTLGRGLNALMGPIGILTHGIRLAKDAISALQSATEKLGLRKTADEITMQAHALRWVTKEEQELAKVRAALAMDGRLVRAITEMQVIDAAAQKTRAWNEAMAGLHARMDSGLATMWNYARAASAAVRSMESARSGPHIYRPGYRPGGTVTMSVEEQLALDEQLSIERIKELEKTRSKPRGTRVRRAVADSQFFSGDAPGMFGVIGGAVSDVLGRGGAVLSQAAAKYSARVSEQESALAEEQRSAAARRLYQTEQRRTGLDLIDTADEQKVVAAAALMQNASFATDAFAASMGAAIDAAISGGDSIGNAMKKAAAASLKATAVQSGVQAVYETAAGLASLAVGDPRAGLHFTAAGKYALTAALAGAGAAALGGGGAGNSAGGSGGGGGGGGGAGAGFVSAGRGDGDNRPIQITIQGDVTGSNAPEIVRQIEDAIRTGRIRARA